MYKKLKLFAFVLLIGSLCFAQSEGEKAFVENRPEDAVILLEGEIEAGTASAASYNYLGLSYFQLGNYDKSVEAYQKGLGVAGTNKKVLAYNQGNSYYAKKDYTAAANSFSLALTADSTFYNALLNRANAYLMGNKLSEALVDYKRYILLVPQDPQKDSITLLISALETEIADRQLAAEAAEREAQRIAEEERRMKEEIAKREAEEQARREAEEAERQRVEAERKAAEAERRRKLLEDVANSLQNTDSTNMSAGAEDLINFDQEAELD